MAQDPPTQLFVQPVAQPVPHEPPQPVEQVPEQLFPDAHTNEHVLVEHTPVLQELPVQDDLHPDWHPGAAEQDELQAVELMQVVPEMQDDVQPFPPAQVFPVQLV